MVKAVVVAEPEALPEVRDIEVPEVGPGDVRVRIAAAGVCHSDLSMINGTLAPQFPLVPGHEASGTIVRAGAGVDTVQPGDRVVLNWAPACRTCWFCFQGEPWLCSAVEGVTSVQRGHLAGGTPAHAAMGVGAFAEEVVLPARFVVPLPDGVPLNLAALMGCAVLTGIGAVRNTARVRSGESVLVVGLGGIGLCTVIGARLAGAGPIIAVDLSPEKEKLARGAGATHFIPSDPKLSKQVRPLTGGRGVDHAFECVGSPTTIRMAWGATRRGGRCTVVGLGGKDEQVTFSPLELFHFARTLTSSVYGSCDPDRDIPMLAEQVRLGRLDLNTLVTDRITLDGVPGAFEKMKAGHGARSLIELDSEGAADGRA
ncbi:MAG: zinc-binding dehydrogenase [Pseudonocardiaceae bacterium]|nr:zinc-binding dehydrogenase [Pseudonocardiaceae bacterium]